MKRVFSSVASCNSPFFPTSLISSQLQALILYHTSPVKNQSFHRKSINPSVSPNEDAPSSKPKPDQLATSHRNSIDFDPTLVLETLSCYSNDWKKALEFFNWVESQCGFEHTTQTYNQVIDVLGKFFEFGIAWNLIYKMKNSLSSKPYHTTFRIMFVRYVRAHLVKEAIDAFDKLEEFNLKDSVSFSNLVDALCEYKHVIEAQELCFGNGIVNERFSCFSVELKIYNLILRGFSKMSWWGKCREFWEEMDRRGVEKDLFSYSIYMDVQCKSGKPWKAVKLFKEMKKKGIKLDVVAYNTAIRAVGISDGVDVAVKLFQEMIELGCTPTVVTFNTILKFLCENMRYKEAYKVLDMMSKKGCEPNVSTYHCFFRCLEKPREILTLFDRMIERGVQPQMDTYVMLMSKFGRWGFLRPVLSFWKKMEEHGLSPDESAYHALIDALVQKGMVDMAHKYDEEMLAKGLSPKPRVELGTKMMSTNRRG
nr:pentatricopeptide repeat-containing protein At1g80550, mitochondrial-like [Ipomoea batatas]